MSSRFPCRGRLFALAVFFLLQPLICAVANPDEDDSQGGQDYQIEAAFLFNFAKFVEWPARKFNQPDSPLIIGIVGADPFGGLLEEAVQEKRINDRNVIVRHIESMEELRKCHILFIARSETSRLGPILSEVRWDNVLTVGETDKFPSRGGMINFVTANNTVRFQINNGAARRAGLKISSKLLQLAVASAQ